MGSYKVQLGPQLDLTDVSCLSLSYLTSKGASLRPHHIVNHVTEVHPIGKLIWPGVVKRWVLV